MKQNYRLLTATALFGFVLITAHNSPAETAAKETAPEATSAEVTTPTNTEPDNTAKNARDSDHTTVTPLDQGNSQADINTTAQIRKEIIAGKEMSVNAKNVKIITNNGHVILRGPVDSSEEKRIIGDIANKIAQAKNVDNQLEVKPATTRN